MIFRGLGGLTGSCGPARTAGGFAWLAFGGMGGVEEGNLVVSPAASLRPSAERKPTHRARSRAMNGGTQALQKRCNIDAISVSAKC